MNTMHRFPMVVSIVSILCLMQGVVCHDVLPRLAAQDVDELDEMPERLVIATWNMEWFFDDQLGDNRTDLARAQSAPSRAAWQWKVAECARVIAAIQPDILALQEVENRKVLADLVNRLRQRHQLAYRVAWTEGTDVTTEQDVALLYRGGLVWYGRREQTWSMFTSNQYYNLSKHIVVEFAWRSGNEVHKLLVCTVHLRAAPEQEAVRIRQARLLHHWMRPALLRDEDVIVLGDFNSEVLFGDSLDGRDLGVISGLETASADDDLTDAHQKVPASQRATHLSGRQYDRIFLSRSLRADAPAHLDWVWESTDVRSDLVIRGTGRDGPEHFESYYAVPEQERDVSDHYPVVVTLRAR